MVMFLVFLRKYCTYTDPVGTELIITIKFTPAGYIAIICSWIQKENIDDKVLEPTYENIFRRNMKVINLMLPLVNSECYFF